MFNTTLTAPVEENKDTICSFTKCLTCPCANCYTGQMAREHGKKGYDEVMKMLEYASAE